MIGLPAWACVLLASDVVGMLKCLMPRCNTNGHVVNGSECSEQEAKPPCVTYSTGECTSRCSVHRLLYTPCSTFVPQSNRGLTDGPQMLRIAPGPCGGFCPSRAVPVLPILPGSRLPQSRKGEVVRQLGPPVLPPILPSGRLAQGWEAEVVCQPPPEVLLCLVCPRHAGCR